MFSVGNITKTTPTTNTLTYNEDLFNNNTLLYTENLLFLGNTPPKTITCWIKINPNNKNTVILGESSISKWTSTFALKTSNSDSLMNRLVIELVNTDGTKTIRINSNRAVITNQYHNIALTYYSENSRNYLELYTDGLFDLMLDVTDFNFNFDRFTIGGQQSNRLNRYLTQGDIINLTIWDSRLSRENILFLSEQSDYSSNGD